MHSRLGEPCNHSRARCVALGLALLAFTIAHSASLRTCAAQVVLWDASRRFADVVDLETRAGWKPVPSELFVFETDPAKAASDPGYYGREYAFEGDTIVENPYLTVVFWSATGRIVLYPKTPTVLRGNGSPADKTFVNTRLELVGLQRESSADKITRCQVLRHAGDEIVIEAFFAGSSAGEASAVFSFGKDQIVEIKPSAEMKGFRLRAPLDYGILPDFIGDDLIFAPDNFTSADTLAMPAENAFVGLLAGEATALVMTWPTGSQELKLRLANDPHGRRTIESVEFAADGQSLYLASLHAPGIWHREVLKPAYLEKDVTLSWKPPFPARWQTQLTEAGVRTTFAFRASPGQVWRGVPGSYTYPVWFDGEAACYHLSKKIPPKGESIVYFLEGQDTPPAISTPVDIIKATLGRQACEQILDVAGRKLRTHHRRGGEGVHRACTCGCTEAIQAVFEAGQEVARKNDVQAAVDDMIFFVKCHVERIDEYQRFAADTSQFLDRQTSAHPELKQFLEALEQTLRQIPEEYEVQQENMRSLADAAELSRQTMALTASRSTNNLAAYMELLSAWRAMGGAQDYVLAKCHLITRKLFQEAGYGCVTDPSAIAVAREIRARCRRVLRNPDGYEIWANY